jgi:Glycosyl transferase family 2
MGAGKTYLATHGRYSPCGDGRSTRAVARRRALGEGQVSVAARPGGGDPVATVVIPAHDEEAVIGRLLDSLADGLDGERLDVIVACNGCTDRTEDVARERGARVVTTPEASKIAALNAGDAAAAPGVPRVFVDADVIITGRAVADVARALGTPGVLCAAPPLVTATAGRPWAVRAWYDVWNALPWFADAPVGSGVYAFSAEGRARFDAFPPIIADDLFARNLFLRTERRVVATDPFVVQAPYDLRSLVMRRTRIYAGNMEVAADPTLGALPGGRERTAPWWRALVEHPRLLPKAVPYLAVNAVAKLRARRLVRGARPVAWGRDDTTRTTSPAGSPS